MARKFLIAAGSLAAVVFFQPWAMAQCSRSSAAGASTPAASPAPWRHAMAKKTRASTTARTTAKNAGKPVTSSRTRAAAAAAGPSDEELDLRDRLKAGPRRQARSEEHTSELQSRVDLVCRLLLEKKKTKKKQSKILSKEVE